MSDSLTEREAYIEVMLLMAAADGEFQEEEAIQLAQTVSSRPEFEAMSETDIEAAMKGALVRIKHQSVTARLVELADLLSEEKERFKALVFAYSILIADGVVAPGETRCLHQMEEAFGLDRTVPMGERLPLQKRAEETRERIIQAGLKLFSTMGYHATSSKRIAKEAGVAIGSFYNYFEDKKTLLHEIHSQQTQQRNSLIFEATAELQSVETADAAVRLIVQRLREFFTISPEFHRESAMLKYREPDIQAMLEGDIERATQLVITGLSVFRDQLRVADVRSAAYLVVKTVESMVDQVELLKPAIQSEAIQAEMEDMLMQYLFE